MPIVSLGEAQEIRNEELVADFEEPQQLIENSNLEKENQKIPDDNHDMEDQNPNSHENDQEGSTLDFH